MEQLCAVYDMAASTMKNDIMRAKRIVQRLKDVEALEKNGQRIPQSYVLAPLLRPGQQISRPMPPPTPSLNDVLNISQDGQANGETNEQTNGAPKRESITPANSTASGSPRTPNTPSPTTLLSARMKTTLARLHADLHAYPDQLPPLATLATRFKAPIECLGATKSERRAFASCETEDTIAAYISWCAKVGDDIVDEHGSRRVASCLSHIIRLWRDEVLEAEEAGDEELAETFLEVVMRRLEDPDEVGREVDEAEKACKEAAFELELAEPVEARFLML